MSQEFNIREVFEMAIRIEEDGAAFYRQAAKIQKSDEESKILLHLASMEDDHRAQFVSMRDSLAGHYSIEDPQDEGLLYLEAIADAHKGEGDPSRRDELSGSETLAEIIETAIDLEERSILFYVGIQDAMPRDLGADTVERIITEEKKHVVQLNGMLKKFG